MEWDGGYDADGGGGAPCRAGRTGSAVCQLSQGFPIGFRRRARRAAPHRRRKTAMDERRGVRRNRDPLPAHAGTEYRRHNHLRRIEAPWSGRGGGRRRRLHPDPVGSRVGARQPLSSLYASRNPAKYPGWTFGCCRRPDDRDRVAPADAPPQSPAGFALCRPRFHWTGSLQAASALRFARPGANQHRRYRYRRRKSIMKSPSASLALAAHLVLRSSISFGGFPSVLPDVRNLATANGWVTDREFADFFAISQVVPGPNMILMMSFVGLKVGGLPGAVLSAVATFGPPSLMYYTAYRLWDRFRDRPWQQIVRRSLAPLTIGIVISCGYVMALAADVGWQSALITAGAAGVVGGGRPNPRWVLVTGGRMGGLGLLLVAPGGGGVVPSGPPHGGNGCA